MSAMKRQLEDAIYDMNEKGYPIESIASILGVDIEMVNAYVGPIEEENK